MIPPQRRAMLFLALVLIASMILAACGGEPAATPEPPAATATLPPPTPAPPTATPVPPTATPVPATPTAAPPAEAPAPAAAGNPEKGQQVAQTMGCLGCHSIDGSKIVGPSWQGLFGKTETFADDSSTVVDEAYIRESILTPSAKVVAGFADGLMPKTFGDQLSEEQIADVIAYIKSLQ